MLRGVGNAVAVQLFRRLPWLGSLWARRHRFVESATVPWAPVTKPVRESVIEPQTPRSSAVPPAGKPRPRQEPPAGEMEPQPQS